MKSANIVYSEVVHAHVVETNYSRTVFDEPEEKYSNTVRFMRGETAWINVHSQK